VAVFRVMNSSNKLNFSLSESEWQTVLDALSNTVFNEDLTEEARKIAKELFIKMHKDLRKKIDL
jgi:hypothetical protein